MTTANKMTRTLTRTAAPDGPWRAWTARDYVEATPPAGLASELDAGGWTVRPVDAGQIVEHSYSGRDGCPGWSPWLRVADRSDGSVRYYVRRDLADELERYGARAC